MSEAVVENEIGSAVIAAAIDVHRALGPGLLESVYEACLADELERRTLSAIRQQIIPIHYKGRDFDHGFKADIVVNNLVLIELKSVVEINPVHRKQIQTYLKLSGYRLGYILNFGAATLKDGIVRVVNNLPERPDQRSAPLRLCSIEKGVEYEHV